MDVTETRHRLPIGAWGDTPTEKEIGRYNMLNFIEGMEGALLAACTRLLGMTVAEVMELVESSKAEVKDRRLRLYCYM